MEEKDSGIQRRTRAVILTLADGPSDGGRDFWSKSIPEAYNFELQNDDIRHVGLQNKTVRQDGFPFLINKTQTDKERADQLIQFFNDPESEIAICPGGEGICGTLYWFDKYRRNPEQYIAQRKSDGSTVEYFPPRSETEWIKDNKMLLVSSDTEELGPYCDAGKIAYVTDTIPWPKWGAEKTRSHESLVQIMGVISSEDQESKCVSDGFLRHIAGKKPESSITQNIDIASSRMMANQDRTMAGEFRRIESACGIIVTELYDWGVSPSETLAIMHDKLSAAEVLIVNPDYVKRSGIGELEKISRKYPNIAIFQGDIAPTHSGVAMPCVYAQTMTIRPDGNYSMLVQKQNVEERLAQNARYNSFVRGYDIISVKAPNLTQDSQYSSTALEYIKLWSANEAVNLHNKDVVLTLDACLRVHPCDYVSLKNNMFQSSNRDLTNLLVAGAFDGAKSLTLNLPFDRWWSQEAIEYKAESADDRTKHQQFYAEYPTYQSFVEGHPLFNHPQSPILFRAREFRDDYGIDVRVSVPGFNHDAADIQIDLSGGAKRQAIEVVEQQESPPSTSFDRILGAIASCLCGGRKR